MIENNNRSWENDVIDLLKHANLPENKIIILHAKLKDFKEITGASYADLSKAILNTLDSLFSPVTILVPSFTYTFTKSGIYHKQFSKSEVGRFSEEVRCFAPYRTPDPIFNLLDTKNYLPSKAGDIDYRTAFDRNSLFEFLDREDSIIVNLGLDHLVSTQLHYIERCNRVSYRYDKFFTGVIYYDEVNWEHINYKYYVRNLEKDPKWNRNKIKEFLIQSGALHCVSKNNIELSWITAQSKNRLISKELRKDEMFLIT